MKGLKLASSIAFALLLSLPLAAHAQTTLPAPTAIEFSGGPNPVSLDVATLEALPQIEEKITFNTKNGPETAVYKGPLLWDVVGAAKLLDGLERNHELARTLSIHAVDGYEIAYSIGEIAPEFGNAKILLALETDGHKLKDGFRIVVQGDKRGARAIHNVTKIELK